MQACDALGNPYPGASLYTYDPVATTTPKATYTDNGLTTPSSNPVVADSAGVFPQLFATTSEQFYCVLKTSAGVLIDDAVFVTSLGPASAVGTVSIADGAVTTPKLADGSVTIEKLDPAAVSLVNAEMRGLTLSAAGATATFGVAAGMAADSTRAAYMVLASAYTKNTASWVVGSGNGALDTGSIANSTWYHVFLIRRPGTGVIDVLISLSPTAPTMPASYTQFRRIGSMRTDGSAQWRKFVQLGDQFLWDSPPLDVSVAAGTTSATLHTLTVPTGLTVEAMVSLLYASNAGTTSVLLVTSPLTLDRNAASTDVTVYSTVVNENQVRDLRVMTNSSAQIRSRSNVTTGSVNLTTWGWIDRRGRD